MTPLVKSSTRQKWYVQHKTIITVKFKTHHNILAISSLLLYQEDIHRNNCYKRSGSTWLQLPFMFFNFEYSHSRFIAQQPTYYSVLLTVDSRTAVKKLPNKSEIPKSQKQFFALCLDCWTIRTQLGKKVVTPVNWNVTVRVTSITAFRV